MKSYQRLSQSNFARRAAEFIKYLPVATGSEKKQSVDIKAGACGALTIMMIRAWSLGQLNEYCERLDRFNSVDALELEVMADLLQKYYDLHSLSNVELEKQLTQEAKHHEQSFKDLNDVKGQSESSLKRGELRSKLISELAVLKFKQELKEKYLAKEYNEEAVNYFADQNLQDFHNSLEFSKQIYIFIQSVLFLQKYHDLLQVKDPVTQENRSASQFDIFELLKIIDPDTTPSTMHQSFMFGFLFKEDAVQKKEQEEKGAGISKELAYVLEESIQENDLVYLCSSCAVANNHAVFLTKQNGKWLLIDPNGSSISDPVDTAHELTSLIKSRLFSKVGRKTNGFLPISFHVVSNSVAPVVKERPSIKSLVDNIIARRGTNSEINATSECCQFALGIASSGYNPLLIEAILQHDPVVYPVSGYNLLYRANPKEIGFLPWCKRNWKTILAGACITAAVLAGTILTLGAVGVGALVGIAISEVAVGTLSVWLRSIFSEMRFAKQTLHSYVSLAKKNSEAKSEKDSKPVQAKPPSSNVVIGKTIPFNHAKEFVCDDQKKDVPANVPAAAMPCTSLVYPVPTLEIKVTLRK